jgi:hypothetical protein
MRETAFTLRRTERSRVGVMGLVEKGELQKHRHQGHRPKIRTVGEDTDQVRRHRETV